MSQVVIWCHLCLQWETAFIKFSWSLSKRSSRSSITPVPFNDRRCFTWHSCSDDLLVQFATWCAYLNEPEPSIRAGNSILSQHWLMEQGRLSSVPMCVHTLEHSVLSCTAITCKLPLTKSLLGCCHTWTWLPNKAFFHSLCCQPRTLISQSLLRVKRFQKSFHLQLLTE